MLRIILALVLGIMAGSAFNMALVIVSNTVYPLPSEIDPDDFAAFQAHVEANGLPTGAFLIVLLAHAGGSLVSALVLCLVAKRPLYLAAGILGIMWTCAGIYMLTIIPAPIWFAVADVVLYVPAALLGAKLGSSLSPSPATPVATEAD